MSDNNLENLLEDSATVPASQPEVTPVRAQEPVAPTGDKQDAAPPTATPKEEPEGALVPRQAVLDERRKRQELERRFKELEERIAAQPKQAEPESQIDWITQPEDAAQRMQAEMQARIYHQAVYTSEKFLKQQYPDYDEVSQVFTAAAHRDPQLRSQVLAHPFPAEFAYEMGQRIKLMQDIGSDPGAYRARLEAEILAKHNIGQQSNPAPAPQPKPQAAVPRSLARDVSQQPRNNRGQFDGPASLDDILG